MTVHNFDLFLFLIRFAATIRRRGRRRLLSTAVERCCCSGVAYGASSTKASDAMRW